MAEQTAPQSQAPKKAVSKFYRSANFSGLVVVVGPVDPNNPVAPETVRFTPYHELVRGEAGEQRVGYLETSDERAHAALADDFNVEEIDEDEFKQATQGKHSKRASL